MRSISDELTFLSIVRHDDVSLLNGSITKVSTIQGAVEVLENQKISSSKLNKNTTKHIAKAVLRRVCTNIVKH